jgi:hypothetical protein
MREADVGKLGGLWRRSLIVRADGTRDTDSWVRWLQGPRDYVDLRQPTGRPDFTGAHCLRDLTMKQLEWLATQDGFAGQLGADNGIFEWRRDIDFQPPGPALDRGSLDRDGDVMVETGHHSPYIEHWHLESGPTQPLYAMRLRDSVAGCVGQIVRIGDVFTYARGRAEVLPELPDLGACVDGAGSLSRAQDLVDCEISFGSVSASGWTIERSTLPFKEGCRLRNGAIPNRDSVETFDVDALGRKTRRLWEVIFLEGEMA